MGKALGWIVVIVIVLVVIFYYFGTSPEERRISAPPSPTPTTPSVVWTKESLQQRLTQLVEAHPEMKQVKMVVEVQQVNGKDALIRVNWEGDVASHGGEYLDLLITEQIIRDFETTGGNSRWFDQDSRSHWYQDFPLKLR